MRVLQINKFGWRRGGSEAYVLDVCEQLTASGVEVGLWAAEQSPVPGVRAFEASIPDFHAAAGIREKFDAACTVIWSRAAQRSVADVLDEFSPDVVHLHLYAHQFSSSIIALLRERGIASVATAHDYKLICPAYLSVRDGNDCFRCARRLSPVAIQARCLHGKISWSAIAMAEAMLVRRRQLLPDVVVAPSEFMLKRLEDSWLGDKVALRLLRHPARSTASKWCGSGGYLLYVGRLSPEKGVAALVAQARELKTPLIVAGDGPERGRLEKLADGAPITFVGHVPPEVLTRLRKECRAQVVPSAWPENFPLAALEAAVDGVPLVVSPRGGAPELLQLGARGAVARDATASSLAAALADLARADPDRGEDELEGLRDELSWERHVPALVETYTGVRVQSEDSRVSAGVRSGVVRQAARTTTEGGMQ